MEADMVKRCVAVVAMALAVGGGALLEAQTAQARGAQACYMVAKSGWLTYFAGPPKTECFASVAKMHAAEAAVPLYPVSTATMPGASVEFVVPRATTCYYKFGFQPWSIDNLPDGVVNVRPIAGSHCNTDYLYWRLHYKYASKTRTYRTVTADTPLSDNPSWIRSILFDDATGG